MLLQMKSLKMWFRKTHMLFLKMLMGSYTMLSWSSTKLLTKADIHMNY